MFVKLEAAPVIFLVAILGLFLLIQGVRADTPTSPEQPARAEAVVAYENDEISATAEGISRAVIVRARPDLQRP